MARDEPTADLGRRLIRTGAVVDEDVLDETVAGKRHVEAPAPPADVVGVSDAQPADVADRPAGWVVGRREVEVRAGRRLVDEDVLNRVPVIDVDDDALALGHGPDFVAVRLGDLHVRQVSSARVPDAENGATVAAPASFSAGRRLMLPYLSPLGVTSPLPAAESPSPSSPDPV